MRYFRKIEDKDIGKYPTADWIIDAELKPVVKNEPRKYWKISAGKLAVKTAAEKMATNLQNPAPEDVIGVTQIVNNPARLNIVNGIIIEAN